MIHQEHTAHHNLATKSDVHTGKILAVAVEEGIHDASVFRKGNEDNKDPTSLQGKPSSSSLSKAEFVQNCDHRDNCVAVSGNNGLNSIKPSNTVNHKSKGSMNYDQKEAQQVKMNSMKHAGTVSREPHDAGNAVKQNRNQKAKEVSDPLSNDQNNPNPKFVPPKPVDFKSLTSNFQKPFPSKQTTKNPNSADPNANNQEHGHLNSL